MKAKLYLIFLFTIVMASIANSQIDRTKYITRVNPFIFDIFAQAGKDDSLNICVFYKIAYQGLVFVQNQGNLSTNLQIEAVFRDNDGIIRRRSNHYDTILVQTFDETKDKNRFRFGYLQENLPSSLYTIQIQVTDLKGQVIYKTSINLKNDLKNRLITPLFSYKIRGTEYVSQMQQGFSFAANDLSLYVPINPNLNDQFAYNIIKIEDKNEINWGEFKQISGECSFLIDTTLFFELSHNGIIVNFRKSTFNTKFIIIKNLRNNFIPGLYQLILRSKTTTDTINFKVIWENMPQSLKNPDYAFKIMEYILTDEEIKQFKSYRSKDIPKKIFEYWTKKDPSLNTPYNEAMQEYFARADYASLNFQTAVQKDGALTDRGMIYILYGPPDDIRTTQNNNKIREIWTYNRLIKEFTFDQVSSGVYRLTQIKE